MITLFGKPEPTLLERLKDSVAKTRSQLATHVEELLAGERRIDPQLLAELENALLAADLGVRTTREILQAVRDKVERNALTDAAQLKAELKSQLLGILEKSPASPTGCGKKDAACCSAPQTRFGRRRPSNWTSGPAASGRSWSSRSPARTPPQWCTTRWRQRAPVRPTRSSWTPPGDCTPSQTL